MGDGVELWKCSDKIEKDSTLNFSGSGILVVGWDMKLNGANVNANSNAMALVTKQHQLDTHSLSLVFGLATYTQDVNCGFDFLLFEHSIRMVGFIICSKMNYFPKRVVVLLLFLWLNQNRLYHFFLNNLAGGFCIFSTNHGTTTSRCVDSLHKRLYCRRRRQFGKKNNTQTQTLD